MTHDLTQYAPEFLDFWQSYPRKVAKVRAYAAWKRLAPSRSLITVIMQELEKQKRSESWEDPKFIPHPGTWLNGRRWEDEVPEKPRRKPRLSL